MVHRPIKDSTEMVCRDQEEHLALDIYLAHFLVHKYRNIINIEYNKFHWQSITRSVHLGSCMSL